MTSKYIRKQYWVTPVQAKKVKAEAKKNKCSESEIIRQKIG